MIELDNIKMMLGSGLSSSKNYNELKEIVRGCIGNGINSFDTAPSYGTESLIGHVLADMQNERAIVRSDYWIQTKIDPPQMQENNGEIIECLKRSLNTIETEYLDAILVHWPIPEYIDKTLHSLERAQKDGLVRYVGICNVRRRHIEELLRQNHIIDIVQIERHPLRTCDEDVAYFLSQNITVQVYSPLCKMNSKIQNNKNLQMLARKYQCNIGQLIMRWHIDTGVIPVFTTKKISRIQEYSKLYEFSLSREDICLINAVNENYKMYLESWLCPGY